MFLTLSSTSTSSARHARSEISARRLIAQPPANSSSSGRFCMHKRCVNSARQNSDRDHKFRSEAV